MEDGGTSYFSPSSILHLPSSHLSSSLRFHSQQISLPAPRVNQLGLEVPVDLVPQITDVNVHHVAGGLIVLVVQVFPDVGARDHLPLPVREVLQQGVFTGGQLDRLPAALRGFAGGVDL